MSAVNRSEGRRHKFAAEMLERLGRDLVVPWPVLVEVDLLRRGRGHSDAATTFSEACRDGYHRLEHCGTEDLSYALALGARYSDSGVDLPDLSVMSIARRLGGSILTWDFRHFRSVVPRRGTSWKLAVDEHQLPAP